MTRAPCVELTKSLQVFERNGQFAKPLVSRVHCFNPREVEQRVK